MLLKLLKMVSRMISTGTLKVLQRISNLDYFKKEVLSLNQRTSTMSKTRILNTKFLKRRPILEQRTNLIKRDARIIRTISIINSTLLSRSKTNINKNLHYLHLCQEKTTYKTLVTSQSSNVKRKKSSKLEPKLV